jgi:hypothetical protein
VPRRVGEAFSADDQHAVAGRAVRLQNDQQPLHVAGSLGLRVVHARPVEEQDIASLEDCRHVTGP